MFFRRAQRLMLLKALEASVQNIKDEGSEKHRNSAIAMIIAFWGLRYHSVRIWLIVVIFSGPELYGRGNSLW